MKQKGVEVSGVEGKLWVYSWRPENEPIGVIHILHGMAEHALRYGNFAAYMVECGYAVYAHDHRKHGKSLNHVEEIGIFQDSDTFENMVEDVHLVNAYIRQIEKDKELVILGHSMGSMICRRYLQVHGNDVKKAVIMGTMLGQKFICDFGMVFGKIVVLTSSKKERSELLNRLSVGGFNQSFEPSRTLFDWISRDEAQVDKYVQDPLCGYSYNAPFYIELIKGLLIGQKRSNILKTPHIPLLFISGGEDPVGFKGMGVKRVISLYGKLGYKDNITFKLFEGARHEILNEINKEEVYQYIHNWIKELV